MLSMPKLSLMTAIVFLAIGLVAGFVTDMFIGYLGWETGLLTSFLTFGVFFALLVWMGKAKWNLSYLLMFCVLGFISSWISGFLGDMWGLQGSLYGSAISLIVFFLIVALIGPEKTGVQTSGS